jgi:hypothetical protein
MILPPLSNEVSLLSPGPMNCNAAGDRTLTFLFVSSICIRIKLVIRLPSFAIKLHCNASLLATLFTFSVVLNLVIIFTLGRNHWIGSTASSLSDLLDWTGTFRCSLNSLKKFILPLTTFPKMV